MSKRCYSIGDAGGNKVGFSVHLPSVSPVFGSIGSDTVVCGVFLERFENLGIPGTTDFETLPVEIPGEGEEKTELNVGNGSFLSQNA